MSLIYLQLLQNLGKVDRTADEIFDEHLTNFNRQQTNASRLQKEFNNYIRCVRGMKLFLYLVYFGFVQINNFPSYIYI